ncbi:MULTISPECIES: biotin-dependent carboxyltransferase family protein [unclassified Paenibacillus]|uniref:5-oxoprolinase subunit C family protein n=1 Tax=unclassified Paenibacillus TaxID=185978 RepID=UPI002404A3A0|nr:MULTISPECIES: biotin-dependent carboxyltransferase family protein [unclassified Paenibacillus]MDF9840758.1 antagonist of KipI [Paenibacillus sp. PastF-2]MDF9847341.1 antagonist of KipI [Paenibacillus sp. PastM-2]MDF9854081.1 antagonist of KipI [Paenibacillus sp. PastF-1]MDH6479354.1 antagonist of KipI [Paenibacillus sp. PastH-2]MDH6506913.1 antagonist of KipI [Paenibacillus sp. PastM-3]
MSISVLQPGMLTSIQDLGRYGYQKYGVIVSGAMDTYSLRTANLLVGNDEAEAALEMTLMGPSLLIKNDTLLAITGGDLSPVIDKQPVPMWRPLYVKGGSVLEFGACKSGCRAYLAVAGGYHIPAVMGSKSTYLRAGIGGYEGRALKEGDELALETMGEKSKRLMRSLQKSAGEDTLASTPWYAGGSILKHAGDILVRVTRGSQFERFDDVSRNRLYSEPFQITPQSDRMGYRLSGPALQLEEPFEMISEGVCLGTVQVPPDGNPIILLADRQTVGGYPSIAQVAVVDIALIAQMKPGQKLAFQEITAREAEKLYLDRERDMEEMRSAISLKLAQGIAL